MPPLERQVSPPFPGDVYRTAADRPLSNWDKILLGSRWPLYIRFITRVVLKSRRLALNGEYDRLNWVRASLDIMECIELSGGKFFVEGLDRLRGPEKALVIVANHVGTLETLILPALIAGIRPATFVVKKSLVGGPAFGPIMRSCQPVVVGRENPREDLERVLKEGTEKLLAGTSIILFPESTRQKVFDPKKFNSLGIKLARRANVPILPLALKTDFWGTGTLIRPFGPVRRDSPILFKFGPPMAVTGNGRQEHSDCIEFIRSHLERWQHPVHSHEP